MKRKRKKTATGSADVQRRKPADKQQDQHGSGPSLRLAAGVLLAGAVVSGLAIILVSGGPQESRDSAGSGGVSVVEKTPPRPTPNTMPPAPAETVRPSVSTGLVTDADRPPGAPAPRIAASPQPAQKAAPPEGAARPVSPPDLPQPQPEVRPALPWQGAPETSGQGEESRQAGLPPQSAPAAPVNLPAPAEIASWVRSQAREFAGGVDAEGMPLYRFDIWLEAPEALRPRIIMVAYEYFAPSAKPPAQNSTDRETGFRVRFGGAACAEKMTVTLTYDDGQEQRAELDGCKTLN